jgi:molybdate transport system regulatory protein
MPNPSTNSSVDPVVRTRLRIVCGVEDAFGPGKAQLLHALAQSGSLTKAAKTMKMSYMKAWTLVKGMNKHFVEPLVVLSRGGSQGGGAQLTTTGQKVLQAYDQLRTNVDAAAESSPWVTLKELLRPGA